MSFGAPQHQTHSWHSLPLAPSHPRGFPRDTSPFLTAYLWLGERVMCVPLLKRTPMLRLESW